MPDWKSITTNNPSPANSENGLYIIRMGETFPSTGY